MEFLKKNIINIAIASLGLAGIIMMIVLMSSVGELPNDEIRPGIRVFRPDFMGMAIWIAYLVFMVGIVALCICKMFGSSLSVKAWIWITIGLLAGTFMALGLVDAMNNWEFYFEAWRQTNWSPARTEWSKFVVIPVVVQLIGLGLFPLLKGIKMLCRARAQKVSV